MLGRRSIWSNERVIDLAALFVPATDEVWRLQNGNDPECRHFQKIADVGHYRHHRSTRQGIYVCTASGVLLGSMNSHNAEAVAQMLEDSLEQFAAMTLAERKLPADADIRPAHRWEESYQTDGLDLTMYARDLPESCDPDEESQPAWNQDRIWFSQAEAGSFLPPDRERLEAGAEYTLPSSLVTRIVRFSIIDTVRGQTTFYSPEEVADSTIRATIESVSENAITLRLSGQTSAESAKSRGRDLPHGIRTQLLGQATWNPNARRFSSFEIVAVGTRWGRTVFNGRRSQLEESPVGFVIQLTPADAPLVAPSFLWGYRAAWVKGPPRN
ncbi:MAG: hypothetical protein ACR2NP_11285 [Pirellulaceae bacterium]